MRCNAILWLAQQRQHVYQAHIIMHGIICYGREIINHIKKIMIIIVKIYTAVGHEGGEMQHVQQWNCSPYFRVLLSEHESIKYIEQMNIKQPGQSDSQLSADCRPVGLSGRQHTAARQQY